ncbi:hypothetical protein B0F90DRAFT_1649641 [Multifurca ochricompacta]|uniref:MULE transposase domain-containing protein n=1 Tax=Multifurca ochricompacta TaxID=376703 RepID=A0AAD4QJ81_9AGAM|nr:hypothetical protein B0F90DRAFT_1649641 [Multifurca ochricompacta]
METFDCSGWIHITLSDHSNVVFIKSTHCEDHVPYCPIDIPEEVVQYVQINLKLTPTQVSKHHQLWTEILKKHPKLSFTGKSIYHLWSQLSSCTWKRDEDEVQSAQLLLEEFQMSSPDRLYTVEPIPIEEGEGITVIVFVLPEILHQWGGCLHELQLDSAWNTNGAQSFHASWHITIYRSGLPLGYLLIQSNIGELGAKELFLSCFISYINNNWHLQIIFTLTDKDWLEINAFLAIIPGAKHQICYWHAIQAIKMHLSILQHAPAPYNVKVAKAEFSWIDKSFILVHQSSDMVHTCTPTV